MIRNFHYPPKDLASLSRKLYCQQGMWLYVSVDTHWEKNGQFDSLDLFSSCPKK